MWDGQAAMEKSDAWGDVMRLIARYHARVDPKADRMQRVCKAWRHYWAVGIECSRVDGTIPASVKAERDAIFAAATARAVEYFRAGPSDDRVLNGPPGSAGVDIKFPFSQLLTRQPYQGRRNVRYVQWQLTLNMQADLEHDTVQQINELCRSHMENVRTLLEGNDGMNFPHESCFYPS